MKKEEFYYESMDRKTNIRAVRYIPDGEIKAILQIAHGMVEFIDRYDDFAKFLCDKGYLVTGNDHLGHGGSVNSKDDWGYFAEKDGYMVVLDDMYTLTLITKQMYPNKPYFLLGHSMGSFFARLYTTIYGDQLNGAIIMGTGQQSMATLKAGKILCRAIATNKGWRHRSNTVNATAMGSYNKKWEPSLTHTDWLTKDPKIIEFYIHEPRCTFTFTLNGFYNMFSCIEDIIKLDNIKKMPKELPILITSGEDDPVGNFGKDPATLEKIFKDVGIRDVELKLYPNDRHEILNEDNKEEVYNDIYNWMESKLIARA